VTDFCQALPGAEGGPLLDWIQREVRFPSSMVDRIVPATTDADRARAEALLGRYDAGLVVAEPFRQWVIEAQAGDPALPAWELGGVVLTDDVAPWEAAKLRLLNASHSLLAYAGALAGYATIGEAVRDEELRGLALALMTQDARPTLTPPPGLDLDGYCAEVLHRFANPALKHTTEQVAMDGSMKLPLRLLGTVRERLAAGGQPAYAAFAVAAWMVYVARGTDRLGRPLRLQDPIADRLREAAAGGTGGLVDRLLGVREVFDDELAGSAVFADLLHEHVDRLWNTTV
jgi:fructuronate reductase